MTDDLSAADALRKARDRFRELAAFAENEAKDTIGYLQRSHRGFAKRHHEMADLMDTALAGLAAVPSVDVERRARELLAAQCGYLTKSTETISVETAVRAIAAALCPATPDAREEALADLARIRAAVSAWESSRGPIGPASAAAMNMIAGVFIERAAINRRSTPAAS